MSFFVRERFLLFVSISIPTTEKVKTRRKTMNNQKKNESIQRKPEGLSNKKNITVIFERLREYPAFRLAYQQERLGEMLPHLEKVLKNAKAKTEFAFEKDFTNISYETSSL